MIESEADLVTASVKIAKQVGVYLERVGQRDARGSGSDRGVTDTLLSINGHYLPIEFKFGDNKMSKAQEEAARKRADNGVFTFVPYTLEDFIDIIEMFHR